MGRKQGKVKKKINWFLAVIAVLSLLKLLMIQGLVIYPLVWAGCDDSLMKTWALNMIEEKWTGPFTCYIFTKEVGFSFYLAVIHRLHLPYITATCLLYIFASLVMLYAVSHIVKKKWVLCLIYAVTLFHPVMTAVQTGQRVYRNGFATALTLLLFGSLLTFYFEIAEKSFFRNCIWAVLTAGSLGFLWETKSDTIWVKPFTITVLLVAAFVLVKKRKELKLQLFPRMGLLILPFLGIQCCSMVVNYLNMQAYGSTGIAYYGPAMSILTGIETEESIKNVSLSRKTFQKLCTLSPTLATTQKKVEKLMTKYDKYDTYPGDGNVEDGWIGWALIRGFYRSGYYRDCQTASAFYQKVYEELSAAVEAGEIKLANKSFWDSYHLATADDRKELLATIGQVWNYVASHQKLFSDLCVIQEEDMMGSQSFELVTGNHAYYGKVSADYRCVGWIAYPHYNRTKLKVYIEDGKGNKIKKIKFTRSRDVKRLYHKIRGTEMCRFNEQWDYHGEGTFYVTAYQGRKRIARSRIQPEGFMENWGEACIGNIDGFYSKKDLQGNHASAERAVARCNFVFYLYRGMGSFLAWTGVGAYVVFTIFAVREWIRRTYDSLNAWLVVTGIGLSLLVLFAGIAVTHLENCPSISYMYLSAAYPLFNLAAMLSIIKCMESIYQRAQFFHKGGRDGF